MAEDATPHAVDEKPDAEDENPPAEVENPGITGEIPGVCRLLKKIPPELPEKKVLLLSDGKVWMWCLTRVFR